MISNIGGIIGAIFGLAGIAAVVFVLGRQKALESSLNLFGTANDELRSQVESGRDERHSMQIDFERRIADERTDFERRMADERAECATQIGILQGQVTVLTGNLGKDIAIAVLQAFNGQPPSSLVVPQSTVTVSETTSTTSPAPDVP